jgi:hypothetical protein
MSPGLRLGLWPRSGRAVLAAFLALCAAPAGATDRFAVIIGNNVGLPSEVPLRYAEDDAEKIHGVLGELGGFSPENMVLLKGAGAEAARGALIATNDRIRSRVADGKGQAILVVFYSGHADATALHLGSSRLDLEELKQLVRGSASNFRLLLVDSCRSGALTRVKGGGILAEPLAGEGVVFLTSSSSNEDAQESDEIRGSFFTHYLVSGLLGSADENGDGRVTLQEAYRHAFENTLRASSRTQAGLQHPTFHYDIRGKGDVVLTAPVERLADRAVLSFPPGGTYLVLAAGQGTVVAEMPATHRTRTLSLRPGRYLVRGLGSRSLLEGTVAVGAGERRELTERDLSRLQYARLVRKGLGSSRSVHGGIVGWRMRSGLAKGESSCQGPFGGYQLDRRWLTFSLRASVCQASQSSDFLHATRDEAAVQLRAAHLWDLPWVSLGLAVTGGPSLLRQRFDTRGTAPERVSGAFQLGAAASLGVALPRGFELGLEADQSTYWFRTQGMDQGAPVRWATVPTLGFAGSLAKRW